MKLALALSIVSSFALLSPLPLAFAADGATSWVVYAGGEGPGKGKHVVLISGDDEYRSEEALPQLGKILSKQHGFKCTVLFPIDPSDGTIKPDFQTNIPGLEALKTADVCVMLLRFRNLPDEQMQHIDDYVESGKPIVGLRTATHAFNIKGDSKYAAYSWGAQGAWDGGFGRQVLGETWISHHGKHKSEAARGILVKDQASHPILRGIKDGDVFAPSDVYGVRLPLPGDSQPLVLGQVVAGMKFDDPALAGAKNDPMMPIAWTKSYQAPKSGKTGRAFTTTTGAAVDLEYEGTRRLIVNGIYWAAGLENAIPEKSQVDIVGEYKPTMFSFGGHVKGIKPQDHAK
ncbi:MAG: ThuA domain-containing protein [Planctomycetia bacterium]|nr:ThuA domain-containing protein [Planctomycetia bacterium]